MRASTLEPIQEIQLVCLAGASFLIYSLAMALPYNVLRYGARPELTIAKIADGDGRAGVMYVVAFSALFMLYAFAAQITRQHQSITAWLVILIGAMTFNLAMLFLYPVDSSDIFDNILRGRIQSLYHSNPFYDTPVQFLDDPFHPYIAWDHIPSAYGPVWEAMAALATSIVGDSVFGNVLAFKLISCSAYAGTIVVIALTLRRLAPAHTLLGVTLLAWNPLAIYVSAGTGHNDAVMLFFTTLGFLLLARQHFTIAALAQMLGALVKFIPILLVPVILLAGLNHLHNWKARVRYLLITSLACGVLAILAYAPFWHGGDLLNLKWRSEHLTTSLPALVQVTLLHAIPQETTNPIVSSAAALLLVAWVARELWLARHSQDANTFVRVSLSILIFYVLVTCLWVQAWYALWLVPLAALIPHDRLARGACVIAFSFAMKMPLFDFVMQVTPDYLTRETREWQITLGTMGLPWIYFVGPWLKNKVRPK